MRIGGAPEESDELMASHRLLPADYAGDGSADALVEDTDHLLKEEAARYRLVEHLAERELGLQDGEVVAIAGGAVAGWKRMPTLGSWVFPKSQETLDDVRIGRLKVCSGVR